MGCEPGRVWLGSPWAQSTQGNSHPRDLAGPHAQEVVSVPPEPTTESLS